LNALQWWVIFETRCNYLATLEGVVITYQWKKVATNVQHGKKIVKYATTGIELLLNTIDDGMILAFAWLSFSQHQDLFNVGLILGRACKMLVHYYLNGWIFKKQEAPPGFSEII